MGGLGVLTTSPTGKMWVISTLSPYDGPGWQNGAIPDGRNRPGHLISQIDKKNPLGLGSLGDLSFRKSSARDDYQRFREPPPPPPPPPYPPPPMPPRDPPRDARPPKPPPPPPPPPGVRGRASL